MNKIKKFFYYKNLNSFFFNNKYILFLHLNKNDNFNLYSIIINDSIEYNADILFFKKKNFLYNKYIIKNNTIFIGFKYILDLFFFIKNKKYTNNLLILTLLYKNCFFNFQNFLKKKFFILKELKYKFNTLNFLIYYKKIILNLINILKYNLKKIKLLNVYIKSINL